MVDVGVPQPFHNHSLIAELDHLVLLNMREKPCLVFESDMKHNFPIGSSRMLPSSGNCTGRLSLHKKRFVRERKEKEESYVVYLRP